MFLLKRVRRNFRGFAGRDEIWNQTFSEQRDVPDSKQTAALALPQRTCSYYHSLRIKANLIWLAKQGAGKLQLRRYCGRPESLTAPVRQADSEKTSISRGSGLLTAANLQLPARNRELTIWSSFGLAVPAYRFSQTGRLNRLTELESWLIS